MADILLRADTAVAVPVNIAPLIDSGDFVTIEDAVTYNQAGLVLEWNFCTSAGVTSQVAVTPTDTGGSYDWVNNGSGMYEIEIPASGGGTINNDAEGTGWFTGVATGVLPWRGPTIQFVPDAVADIMDGSAAVGDAYDGGVAGAGLTALATQASVNTIDDLLDSEMPALTTAVADLPTNAELATALAAADDAVLAAIAALNDLSSADVQTVLDACGITTAGGVTKIAALTISEGGAAPGSPVGETA